MTERAETYRPAAPSVAEIAAGGVVYDGATNELGISHVRDQDRWGFPKGHVEPGQSIAAAARREITEETGLTQLEFDHELTEAHYRFFDPRRGLTCSRPWSIGRSGVAPRALPLEAIFDRYLWGPVADILGTVTYDTDRAVIERFAADTGPPPSPSLRPREPGKGLLGGAGPAAFAVVSQDCWSAQLPVFILSARGAAGPAQDEGQHDADDGHDDGRRDRGREQSAHAARGAGRRAAAHEALARLLAGWRFSAGLGPTRSHSAGSVAERETAGKLQVAHPTELYFIPVEAEAAAVTALWVARSATMSTAEVEAWASANEWTLHPVLAPPNRSDEPPSGTTRRRTRTVPGSR